MQIVVPIGLVAKELCCHKINMNTKKASENKNAILVFAFQTPPHFTHFYILTLNNTTIILYNTIIQT